jgi:hypothetical protein
MTTPSGAKGDDDMPDLKLRDLSREELDALDAEIRAFDDVLATHRVQDARAARVRALRDEQEKLRKERRQHEDAMHDLARRERLLDHEIERVAREGAHDAPPQSPEAA